MKGKLIDLTLPLFSGAPIWSPEPKTVITDYFTLGRAYGAEEGMNMKVLYMSGHAGTHCDAPVHLRSGRPSLDEIPLERYVGRASVAHLPDKGFDDPWIAIADLEHLSDKLGEGSRLLVHTGWDRFWETDNQTYFDQQKAPKLHLETLAWLRDRKVGLIGVDMPSVNALLEQETVDAALIATPVYQHRDQAVACAQCGVHVLLEKPMARTPAECDEIIAAHKKADTILMVAFMKRFNRSMLKVAELLEEGTIGQVMGVRHNWDWGGHEGTSFAPQWRGRLETWGGQWQDHGSHSVDLARWWAGPVRSVMACFDITEPFMEVDNEYNVICTHASGTRSVHQSSKFFHRESEEHYLIFGETGTIEFRHSAAVWHYTTPYKVYLHRYGRLRENHQPPFSINWLKEGQEFGQYKVELEHFVECVRDHKPPRTTGEDGRVVAEIISAAYLSAEEGREVELPLDSLPDFERFFPALERRIPARYSGQ